YQPVDFRNGIDGLVALCRRELGSDAVDGSVYVFRNRRGTAIKILNFDGHGFWLCTRRFSQGRLQWWPTPQSKAPVHQLLAHELLVLIYNGFPEKAAFAAPWRALQPSSQAATASSDSSDSSP
ncbi:MAG: IS66 family insertion sequence element accessory protein TnpB, partial [Pyrinomonadaceae bacterium]